MSYTPPPHLAIVRSSKLAGDRDVAFWVEAIRRQLVEHVAPAWGMPPPGVMVYDAPFVPSSEGAVIAIVDDDGNDEAAGFHSMLGGVPFGLVDLGQSDKPSVVLSHEAIELWANATLDRWEPGPRRLQYAMELCDPVQSVSYDIEAELFGVRRAIEVSDFVLPAWFKPGGFGRYDHASVLTAPFDIAPGGYAIALEGDAVTLLSGPYGALMPGSKFTNWSRTGRLATKKTKER